MELQENTDGACVFMPLEKNSASLTGMRKLDTEINPKNREGIQTREDQNLREEDPFFLSSHFTARVVFDSPALHILFFITWA